MIDKKELRKEIAHFMRRLYKQQLTTASGGNISAICGKNMLITPSATDKGRMKGGEIGVMDMQGNIVGKKFRPSIESMMHLEIYRRRQDVKAIVHAHPVVASAFSASTRKISTAYLAEAYVVLGEIAYADYGCQGTAELAKLVGDAAEKSNCIVMKNHGIIALGRNLLEAFDRLEVLENAAKTTLICEGAFNADASELTPEAQLELNRSFRNK
ncbi:MAG: class II aldolase/adducin family protein [Victivallaceae bacterium]